jgi:penicillin-binding protein 2
MGLLVTGRRRRWRSENVEQPDPEGQARLRIWLLRAVVVIAFAALTVQLARLQLVRGDSYEQRAALNQLRVEQTTPSRGIIYDRNGVPVVENVPSFAAAVVPADIPEGKQLEVVGGIQRMLGVDPMEALWKIEAGAKSNNPFTPVIIKDGLTREEAFGLREVLGGIPGTQVIVEPVRRYTGGDVLSSLLGYTGRIDAEEYAELSAAGYGVSERLGKAGVEAAYEEYLRGVPGLKQIEKDASGREIRTLGEQASVPGHNLILSVDLDLQRKVTDLTRAAAGSNQAAAIVMDVNTGEILALVSLPLYDNNIFSGNVDEAKLAQYLNDPKKPLVNHALAEQYAPGSIFKQITGSAALQEGVASPGTLITSRGYIDVPNQYDPSIIYRFKDWQALGTLDFYGGIAMSSDVYFYFLGGGYHEYGYNFNGLGIDRLANYTRMFGLGHRTGIDISGEADGLVPDPAWKEATHGEVWTTGDTYNMSIGQGYLATTPIQMVRVTAAVANGGTLLRPRVVREVRDSEGHVIKPNEPDIESLIPISPENFAIVRDAMAQAVSWGTARNSAVRGVSVAGKTGTAEFGQRFADGSYLTHAWYSGFAPAENPEIAVTVFLERGIGSENAAPLAAKIMDYYFNRPAPARADAGGAPIGQQP